MLIQRIYGRPTILGYASKHGEFLNLPLPDWLVGIELEIENFDEEWMRKFGGFTFTDDGSLRSGPGGEGVEAISKPVAIKYVPQLLNAFFKKFEVTEENYSERCSTHIHFNVEEMTLDQVSTICLIYQTVESLLFNFVGNDRDKNIFCVPWNQSNLTYNIVSTIGKGIDLANNMFRRWQKYSSLNLIPITTQGTLEFRHLEGTCDVKRITNWICLIAKIFEHAMSNTLKQVQLQIVNMNTVSNYHQWLYSVFGEYAQLLQTDNFERHLAQGVIDTKLMLMDESKISIDEYIRNLRETPLETSQFMFSEPAPTPPWIRQPPLVEAGVEGVPF